MRRDEVVGKDKAGLGGGVGWKRTEQACLFIVLLWFNGSRAPGFIKLGFENTHSSTKTS